MSNRPVMFLWTSVRVRGKAHVRLFIPLPLPVVLSFVDMLDDFGRIASLFSPYASIQTVGNGKQSIPALLHTITGTAASFVWNLMFFTGPLDLVDIDVEDGNETVKIKILTR